MIEIFRATGKCPAKDCDHTIVHDFEFHFLAPICDYETISETAFLVCPECYAKLRINFSASPLITIDVEIAPHEYPHNAA